MTVRNFDGEIQTLDDTPFGYAMKVISGKWKLVIIYLLAEHSGIRFNAIRDYIGYIPDKTLSKQLKELEDDGIIEKETKEKSTHSAYHLTDRGWTLVPIIEELCYWGVDHKDDL